MMMKVEIVLNTESSNSNEYLFGYLLGQQITYACRTEAKTRHIAQVSIAWKEVISGMRNIFAVRN